MVPSPPSTISTSSFCPAASPNERSISLASPHQIFGSTMPARVRILKSFCSDSEAQLPLEVLIMAPTFNSDKRRSLGTNHLCALVARLTPLALGCALTAVRPVHAARIVSVLFCFFSDPLELFLEASQIFVREFFQIDKFVSSAFHRSDYFVEFQMSRFCIAILRILNEKDHQESNNCRYGIDNEQPGIRILERGAA